jgi:hypothetical protein
VAFECLIVARRLALGATLWNSMPVNVGRMTGVARVSRSQSHHAFNAQVQWPRTRGVMWCKSAWRYARCGQWADSGDEWPVAVSPCSWRRESRKCPSASPSGSHEQRTASVQRFLSTETSPMLAQPPRTCGTACPCCCGHCLLVDCRSSLAQNNYLGPRCMHGDHSTG